jgi:hypothetical protein
VRNSDRCNVKAGPPRLASVSEAKTSFTKSVPSPGQNVLGMGREAAARRDPDSDLTRRAHLRHHPGQRAAVPQSVPVHRRNARPRSRPTIRLLRRAQGDDAQTPPHPRPKPRPPHRHRTPPKPHRPHHTLLKLHRASTTRHRRGTTAVLNSNARFLFERPIAVEFRTCSGCSSSDAATGSDPDRLPVAGVRDAPV